VVGVQFFSTGIDFTIGNRMRNRAIGELCGLSYRAARSGQIVKVP
jgi:hypothetical protein